MKIIYCLNHNKKVGNTEAYARIKHSKCKLQERYICLECGGEMNEKMRKEIRS